MSMMNSVPEAQLEPWLRSVTRDWTLGETLNYLHGWNDAVREELAVLNEIDVDESMLRERKDLQVLRRDAFDAMISTLEALVHDW